MVFDLVCAVVINAKAHEIRIQVDGAMLLKFGELKALIGMF